MVKVEILTATLMHGRGMDDVMRATERNELQMQIHELRTQHPELDITWMQSSAGNADHVYTTITAVCRYVI